MIVSLSLRLTVTHREKWHPAGRPDLPVVLDEFFVSKKLVVAMGAIFSKSIRTLEGHEVEKVAVDVADGEFTYSFE